jgi:ubiquinone/menaquinone biosynthesis C-methylase UbiE
MGRRHIDLGPGTGYFVEQAAPPLDTEITLLDPNPHVLKRASKRLAAVGSRRRGGGRDEALAR